MDRGIQVYSCCPGWCMTDLTSGSKPKRTAEQGATVICDLVLLDHKIDQNIQGCFYKENKWTKID